ncbi:hypothetical protein ACFSKU_09015 [Pontibacter silvestris]|uniref:Uncharacterized protein n=1 Tax=Pontibacter silvestris TaxID=2305183 RepID=A0ABW4WWC5_9BACT|nr:hypothetical protein [Pontibacter silvestris]MCC9138925.1 hypothetical protein [Pontibacter silvestris]
MKQAEKQDAVLRLYSRRHREYPCIRLEEIMQVLNIYESRQETEGIADKLRAVNLVNLDLLEEGVALVHQITSKGMDYCKQDSYSPLGRPTVFLSFTGSIPASSIVLNRDVSGTHQAKAPAHEAGGLISRRTERLHSNPDIEREEKEELLECVEDMEEKIRLQKPVSKYQWRTLINSTSGQTEASTLAARLSQLYGILSSSP